MMSRKNDKKAKQLRTLSSEDLSRVTGGKKDDVIPGVRGTGSSTGGGGYSIND